MDELGFGLRLSRRRFLLAGSATALFGACGSDDPGPGAEPAPTTTTPGDDPTGAPPYVSDDEGLISLTVADFEGLAVCVLLPETTAGPFPLDVEFDRRDITEGYPGHPLRLGMRVIDESCAPIPGSVVEVWHADATGDYSAFADGGGGKDEGEGTTFLRGTQTAGDDGIVEFQTIYPGWYPGRSVHIHLFVRVGGDTVLTSQVFFEDDFTASVFSEAPYVEHGAVDTPNAADAIAGDVASNGTLLTTSAAETYNGVGTLALVNLGVPT